MSELSVKIVLGVGARLPARATAGAAGYDVCASLPGDTYLQINPGDRLLVPTALYLEIPSGYFVTLRPRSGLALKQGLTLLNTPALIDSDYRGELRVLMINLGHEPARIEHGDRIAQMLVEKTVEFSFEEARELSPTERGSGGFGSTDTGR